MTTGCVSGESCDGVATSDFQTSVVMAADQAQAPATAVVGSATCDLCSDGARSRRAGGADLTLVLLYPEGEITNTTVLGNFDVSAGGASWPFANATVFEIPSDQLATTPWSDVLSLVDDLVLGKEGPGDDDCDYGKGSKGGKSAKKCKKSKKTKKGKKGKKNKGDKTVKSGKGKKKKGKGATIAQIEAKMAIKRTSQVGATFIGTVLVVAAFIGYKKSKAKGPEPEHQMLLSDANEVAKDLTYIIP